MDPYFVSLKYFLKCHDLLLDQIQEVYFTPPPAPPPLPPLPSPLPRAPVAGDYDMKMLYGNNVVNKKMPNVDKLINCVEFAT